MADRFKHDKIFRKALQNPLVAHEFCNAHLPKSIKDSLDFSSLKMDNTTFIEQDLRDSITDVLFQAKFDKQDGYLYLLLEHQSHPDHFMAFRLFKYMINICDRHLTQHPNTKTLPLVYPLIFYNGTRKYNAPLNLWKLFENSQLARSIWINDYQLVNVHDIPDSEFRERIWSGILEFFMKHIHERNLLKRWQEIQDILPEFTKLTIGYSYLELILRYTLTRIKQDDKIELEKLLTATLNQETGTKLMSSLAQHWEQIGEAKGIQIGEAKGIQIGEVKGIQIGKAEGKAEMIKMMRNNGYSIEEISRITKLSITEISTLLQLT
ncbi:Rpn family recombination-promoting nuclease/putative transposase [Candidatus Tisiphia endosymbiont of Beris chalybata]|uniref:Rpn family recombination-promoting nuclease/putative transposase n=1 Tax=Candidatus Tisiphia endosymbiont of Beris chalybata TaxID=3066262 RepID=UPI00312C7E90